MPRVVVDLDSDVPAERVLAAAIDFSERRRQILDDRFSRYVVGWMVASRESAALAQVLIRQACAK